MPARADPPATHSPHIVHGDLEVTVTVGARVAHARMQARAGCPLMVVVDHPALLFAEAASPPLRTLLRRLDPIGDIDVHHIDGGRLVHRTAHRGRVHMRWTPRGALAVGQAAWIRVRTR